MGKVFHQETTMWSPYIVGNYVMFWTDIRSEVPELAALALSVLSYCPHAAGCERSWSSLAASHTATRNRLGHSTCTKLERIKMCHRCQKPRSELKNVYKMLMDSLDTQSMSIDVQEPGDMYEEVCFCNCVFLFSTGVAG